MRRTGICGATETILIDRAYPAPLAIVDALVKAGCEVRGDKAVAALSRSEEHTSELQSLMRISYAVFCLKKKKTHNAQLRRQHYTNNTNTPQLIHQRQEY